MNLSLLYYNFSWLQSRSIFVKNNNKLCYNKCISDTALLNELNKYFSNYLLENICAGVAFW